MALLLRRSEVLALMDLRQAMRVLEQTFREQAKGKVSQVPPLRLMNRGMRLVAGGLEAQNRTGLRVSAAGGESVALLFEIASGSLLAVMGYPFSNLRISATIGLAVERLSVPTAKSVALIGTGRLALSILEPAMAVRSINRVAVYSRNPENRAAFARRAAEKLKTDVRAAADPTEAVGDADLVLVSTNSPAAALMGEWLLPDASVFGVGRPNEFDDQVYLRAGAIVVTSKIHELGYYDSALDQPLIRLSREGKIAWDEVIEFCDIVAGKKAVAPDAKGTIVFRDSQGGYGDLALASWAYEEARRRGLGREIGIE